MSDEDPPVVAFERYLAEARATLPERYRNPGRRGPKVRLITKRRMIGSWAAPVGLALVLVLVLAGSVAAWWFGFVPL